MLHYDKLRRETLVPLRLTVIYAMWLQRPAIKQLSIPQSRVRTVLGCAAGIVTGLTGWPAALPLGDAQPSDFSSLLTRVSQREQLSVVSPAVHARENHFYFFIYELSPLFPGTKTTEMYIRGSLWFPIKSNEESQNWDQIHHLLFIVYIQLQKKIRQFRVTLKTVCLNHIY